VILGHHADGAMNSVHEVEAECVAQDARARRAVEVERLIEEFHADLKSGFVVETPGKLRRIVQHFRAHIGRAENVAPRCNAPWVSAVIESSGDVRPCFFHPAQGNIHRQAFTEIINSPEALSFRANLDVATNEICKRCVCSLYVSRQAENNAKP